MMERDHLLAGEEADLVGGGGGVEAQMGGFRLMKSRMEAMGMREIVGTPGVEDVVDAAVSVVVVGEATIIIISLIVRMMLVDTIKKHLEDMGMGEEFEAEDVDSELMDQSMPLLLHLLVKIEGGANKGGEDPLNEFHS